MMMEGSIIGAYKALELPKVSVQFTCSAFVIVQSFGNAGFGFWAKLYEYVKLHELVESRFEEKKTIEGLVPLVQL